MEPGGFHLHVCRRNHGRRMTPSTTPSPFLRRRAAATACPSVREHRRPEPPLPSICADDTAVSAPPSGFPSPLLYEPAFVQRSWVPSAAERHRRPPSFPRPSSASAVLQFRQADPRGVTSKRAGAHLHHTPSRSPVAAFPCAPASIASLNPSPAERPHLFFRLFPARWAPLVSDRGGLAWLNPRRAGARVSSGPRVSRGG